MIMEIIDKIKELDIGEVKENVDLTKYTTYKAGGTALGMVYPEDVYGLIDLIKLLREENIKYKVLGRGSNLIFNSGLYNGILIKLDTRLSRIGYEGLEFATGIPGSVGGAVFMNAGAYKSDMGYVVKSVKVLTPDLRVEELTNYDMAFHYRSSFLQKNPDFICLEATLILKQGDPDAIMQLVEDRKKRRIESQPLEYPSAGSVFRNPEGDFAGRLIEEAGYKGKRIGDAMVSTKHANFVINVGHAKGEDIKELIASGASSLKNTISI